MRVEAVDPLHPDATLLRDAAGVLKADGLVVFPTETVYGLGARPDHEEAMARLFACKGRPSDKAVTWLVADVAEIPCAGSEDGDRVARLAARFWPGPLTVVVDAGAGTQGYRIPDHPVALGLVRALGAPLAATSANRSGRPPARSGEQAARDLGDAVDLVLDGGPVTAGGIGGVASAVIRLRAHGFDLLREGSIDEQEIRDALAE